MREISANWFNELRNIICKSYEDIEIEYAQANSIESAKFEFTDWVRAGGGGGQRGVMRGNVFEKVGVNISSVYGNFSDEMRMQIPGAEENPAFFATGISLVAHPRSPKIPIIHMNTRFIETTKWWVAGGADLTPIFPEESETKAFHDSLKLACDKFNPNYYKDFSKWCDEYFFLKHRNEARGVGGIFYDYINTGEFEKDFEFNKQVGIAFSNIYPKIVRNKMYLPWNDEDTRMQLKKRGRYTEFNLLYDRGTKFGIMTGGDPESILVSLPPLAAW